jgi:uncharacterized protein YaiI (UPF0178 family)
VTTASIWVDADACPNVIKEILFRAAERTGVTVTLVANRPLAIPRVPSLRLLLVADGFDVADKQIVERSAAGDLVITADIPLAAEIIAKGGEALNPRGERSVGPPCSLTWRGGSETDRVPPDLDQRPGLAPKPIAKR